MDGDGNGSARCDIGAFELQASDIAQQPGDTPVSSSTGQNDQNKEDSPRKPTEEEKQQRQRTNRSNRDDEHTEGNVLEVHCDAAIPMLVIANRDGHVEVRLLGGAAPLCKSVRVGDYVHADGVKQHEQLFEADDVSISR